VLLEIAIQLIFSGFELAHKGEREHPRNTKDSDIDGIGTLVSGSGREWKPILQ